ncbi:hypothetical protein ACP70R_037567 [Stipagrostis hirtigluma subsp. patula]
MLPNSVAHIGLYMATLQSHVSGETLKNQQAPYPLALPQPNLLHMAAPNANISGPPPLDIVPLTQAMPHEPVVPTPDWIIGHPYYDGGATYNGGWKTLCYPRDGGKNSYFIYCHSEYGRIRSKKQVLEILDALFEERKLSAHLGEASASTQSFGGNGTVGATQSAEGNSSAVGANQSSEGKSTAGYSFLYKGKGIA